MNENQSPNVVPGEEKPQRKFSRRIDFGGIPHPPESLIPPAFIPEPPLPTPDRVRATTKEKKGQK